MRNYKKEALWKQKKYTEIRANIEKKLGNNLKQKLKNNKITIANWIRLNAIKYLNEE